MSHIFRLPLVLLSSLLLPLSLFCQIELAPAKLNYGITGSSTNWIIDVIIQNKSAKPDFILSHDFSHEYEVLFSSKKIAPDSTVTMRVKFKPRVKGRYREEHKVYFASMQEPIIIPVIADVIEFNPEDAIPCPDFSRKAAECCPNNSFLVEAVNDENGEPIAGASIRITEDEHIRLALMTSGTGRVTQTIPIGYYRITASHKSFTSASVVSYINHSNAHFVLRLKPLAVPPVAADSLNLASNVYAAEAAESVLPSETFRPNNVVFLLDVSSSMKQGEKLQLMKMSLRQLSFALREQDKIALHAYSDDARVLLEPTAGNARNAILTIIDSLNAEGATAGEKGFKSAYKSLKASWIPGGNNQLIVITDGAFQPADQLAIAKLVKKYAKKGISTSVVGVQCASFAVLKLTEVSDSGNGSFIRIEDDNDLNVLIEEMKKRSAK